MGEGKIPSAMIVSKVLKAVGKITPDYKQRGAYFSTCIYLFYLITNMLLYNATYSFLGGVNLKPYIYPKDYCPDLIVKSIRAVVIILWCYLYRNECFLSIT
jgi:hypothetical protein